jgi:hypothetical protein
MIFNYPFGKRQLKTNIKCGSVGSLNPLCPIGKNIIGKWNKDVAKICGFNNAQYCTGHAGRHYFISASVNNPDVTVTSSVTVSGHKTYSAHMTYANVDNHAYASMMNVVAPMPLN